MPTADGPQAPAPDRPSGAGGGASTRPSPGAGGLATGDADDGQKESPLRRMVQSRSFVPTVVVLGLMLLVLLGSRLTGRPPVLDSITPAEGKPGEVMIITGRYFGSERGEVRISGISPSSSDYSEWTDTRISVTIPAEAGSGLVHVVTRNGRSRGLLFINHDEIPVVDTGTAKAGEPWIASIDPGAARIGERITIRGMNFGLERGESRVYFAWTGGAASGAAGGSDLAQLLAARDQDLDYLSWSDREIVLRVPDGAASGNVLATSDKGRSNSTYFEVLGAAGRKSFSRPRTCSVEYGMEVRDIQATGDNSLYLWLALPVDTPEQRRIQLVAQDPEPMVSDHGDATLFRFSNIGNSEKPRISMGFMLERYQVETQVTAGQVPLVYEASSELARFFTAPDRLATSTAPEIVKAARTAVGSEKNPYLKARRVYDWLIGQLAWAPSLKAEGLAAILKDRRADAFAYSALYCALARAAGVPTRMVSGYLAGDPGQPARRHFWDEFYIETVGWVPVDPLLGDDGEGAVEAPIDPEAGRRAFYFGSLDNRHLTFSRGLEEVATMSPDGRTRWRRELPWLLSFHEEAVGAIASYTAVVDDLEVTGAY